MRLGGAGTSEKAHLCFLRSDLGVELGRQPSRRGLAAAAMAQRWRPAALEAALEALELPDGQMQGLAESYLTWPLFRQIVARIAQLAWHPT